MFSQFVEVIGSTCLVRAGNEMDVDILSFSHFTPPQIPCVWIFACEKVRYFTWIPARNVTRNSPDKYSHPVLPESFSSRKECETSRMPVSPTPHEPINMFRILILRTSQDSEYVSYAEKPI